MQATNESRTLLTKQMNFTTAAGQCEAQNIMHWSEINYTKNPTYTGLIYGAMVEKLA
jgi:hypothetical protein